MTWIFEDCPDLYGSCIRQDVLLGLCLIISFLAVYSLVKVFRQQEKFTFQCLPLSINALTSLIMVGLYTQLDSYNIRISLLIIELYCYFILTYGFIFMVAQRRHKSKKTLKFVKSIFIAFTLACFFAQICLIILNILKVITCDRDQGYGSLVLIALQTPLLITAFIYSEKSKTILVELDSSNSQTELNKQHLLSQDEEFVKTKLVQLKLIRLAFIVTALLHVCQIVLSEIAITNSEFVCSSNGNQIIVSNSITFAILTIESITQIFPHLLMPIIFWYLPSRHVKRAVSLYLTNMKLQQRQKKNKPKLKLKRQESRLVNDVQNEVNIRKKLYEHVPKDIQNTF